MSTSSSSSLWISSWIWRPALPPDSVDGQPLVYDVSELLWTGFPFHRLVYDNEINPNDNDNSFASWFQWLAAGSFRPEVLVGSMVFFVVSLPVVQHLCRRQRQRQPAGTTKRQQQPPPKRQLPSSSSSISTVRICTALHNFILAVFSAVCAWNTYALILEHVWLQSTSLSSRTNDDDDTLSSAAVVVVVLRSLYCNVDNVFWRNGMGQWNIIFYWSKFYELFDTYLLLWKQKPATLLQVYHHTVMLAAMWGGVVTQAPWLFIVVALNSVIHTVMYLYFFIKTLYPTLEIPQAKYLTLCQILQFVIGIVVSVPYYLLEYHQCRTSPSSIFMLAFFHAYGISLIVLFVVFAQQKYNRQRQGDGQPRPRPTSTTKPGTTTPRILGNGNSTTVDHPFPPTNQNENGNGNGTIPPPFENGYSNNKHNKKQQ